MPFRNVTVVRWLLYTLAFFLCCAVQGLVLRHILVWEVFPFLYPAAVAVLSDQEGPFAGTAFGLVTGFLCDLTISGPFPGFYTLLFPLCGLLSGLIAQGLVSAGFLCALTSTAASFVLLDGARIALLFLDGQLSSSALPAAALLTARETGLTLLFVLPVHLLFSAIHRKCLTID